MRHCVLQQAPTTSTKCTREQKPPQYCTGQQARHESSTGKDTYTKENTPWKDHFFVGSTPDAFPGSPKGPLYFFIVCDSGAMWVSRVTPLWASRPPLPDQRCPSCESRARGKGSSLQPHRSRRRSRHQVRHAHASSTPEG